WPRLITDLQRVAKTPGGYQNRALAFALEESVRRNCGAHFHRADAFVRNGAVWCESQEVAHALNRSVRVGVVLRKKLVRDQRAVGRPSDHVREGTAPVDPEIPLARRSSCHAHGLSQIEPWSLRCKNGGARQVVLPSPSMHQPAC